MSVMSMILPLKCICFSSGRKYNFLEAHNNAWVNPVQYKVKTGYR